MSETTLDAFKEDALLMNNNNLAEKYGRHRNTISRWKEELDLRDKTALDSREFKTDVLKKMPIEALADKYKVSKAEIRDTIKEKLHITIERRIQKDGYSLIYKPNHPNARKSGFILEHRWIFEKHLGRYLTKEEVVHHKDGSRDNNKIENLMLLQNKAQHLAYHKCLDEINC
jgi:hypothetical protein